MSADDLSLSDWKFIHKHLTYEIINKWIDKTGRAVLLPNITVEEEPVTELYEINVGKLIQLF
jgi:hypothetical protein